MFPRVRRRGSAAAALSALAFACAVPAAVLAQSEGAPVPLGVHRVLRSSVLGEDRLLQVHLPRGYAAQTLRYPVVYVLHSDRVEGYFAQVVNDVHHLGMDRMPPAIVVGVPNTQRYRDLLPWPRERPIGEEGRADRFLAFVRDELIPFVDREYRTQPFRVLVGPQTAAVFGLWTLLEAPGTFQAYVLNDPCVADTPQRSLCRDLAGFSRSPKARWTYLAVSAGAPRAPDALGVLRQELEAGVTEGFRWRIRVDPSWPLALPPVASREALLELFEGYRLPSPAEAESLDDILEALHPSSLDAPRGDRAAVEETVRASIGWALTKDRALLERVMAHDPELFIVNPDSSTVAGWDAFVENFGFWMDPRFKATRFDVRDLRVTFSRSGDVAWWSAVLDDLAEWDGRPVGWRDTRWTGVAERREGVWVITQMHFSFASPG